MPLPVRYEYEPLEEIDVSGYVRRGRHGLVRVRSHTRKGVRRAAFDLAVAGLVAQQGARAAPARARRSKPVRGARLVARTAKELGVDLYQADIKPVEKQIRAEALWARREATQSWKTTRQLLATARAEARKTREDLTDPNARTQRRRSLQRRTLDLAKRTWDALEDPSYQQSYQRAQEKRRKEQEEIERRLAAGREERPGLQAAFRTLRQRGMTREDLEKVVDVQREIKKGTDPVEAYKKVHKRTTADEKAESREMKAGGARRRREQLEFERRRADHAYQEALRLGNPAQQALAGRPPHTLTPAEERSLSPEQRQRRRDFLRLQRELGKARERERRLSEGAARRVTMPAMALDADRDELFAEYSWADDLSPEELDAILESEWVKAHWRRTKHGMVRVGAHARDQARRAVDDADAFHALTGRRTLVHRAAGPLSAAYSRVKNNPKVDLRANPVARARVAALRLADKAANFAADAATMRANLHPSDANQRSANTLQALRALASSLDRMDMKMQSARRAANEQRAATGRPKAQQTPRAPQLTQRQKLEKELRSREAHVDVRMDALDNALRSNDPSRIMAAQRDLADAQRAVRSLKSRLGRLTEAFAEACLSWIEEEEEAMLESLAELDWVSDATLEELEDLVEAVTSGKRWGSVYGSRRRKKPTTGFSSYSAGRGRNARGEITVSRNLKTGAYRKYNVSGRKPKLIGRGGASVSRKKAWSKVGAGTANRLYARGTNLTKNSRRGQSYQLVKVRGRRAHVYGTGASRKVIVLKRK